MRDRVARDDLDAYLRDITTRVERLERHTHRPVARAAPSQDHNNYARLGSDGLLYVRETVYKATAPTNKDYAAAQIPYGSIWVGIPGDDTVNLVHAFDRDGQTWTDLCPAWAWMPPGQWVEATRVHTWDGHQWVLSPVVASP